MTIREFKKYEPMNDEEVKQIEKRSIINSKKEKEEAVIKYFEILKKKREENAKK